MLPGSDDYPGLSSVPFPAVTRRAGHARHVREILPRGGNKSVRTYLNRRNRDGLTQLFDLRGLEARMTALLNTSLTNADRTHTAHHSHSAAPAEREVQEAEARVREQEVHVLRLIVQGAPTQSAEDLLRQLTATAKAMKEQLRLARG